MRRLLRFAGIGLAGLALIAAAVIYLMIPKRAVVIFDNGSDWPVIVADYKTEWDSSKDAMVTRANKILGSIPPFQVLRTASLRPGSRKIRIYSLDPRKNEIVFDQGIKTVDIPSNAVGKQRHHIYNIRKGNHYAIYTMGYGNSPVTRPQIKPLHDRTFFEFDTKYELGDGFPGKIKVPRKVTGSTVTLLGHYPLHRDRPCCQRLRDSLQHLPEYRFGGIMPQAPPAVPRRAPRPPALAHQP